jgi:hypothetical protein
LSEKVGGAILEGILYPTMKNRAAILGLSWLLLATFSFANPAMQRVVGRTIYHPDKSRTESLSNPETRELTETTYSPDNVVTVRKVFLLNEKGEPLQGNVYDGRGNLVARCQSIYDELGRRKEDRLVNLNGEVFQQVLHEYGADGKALKPKVINLNVATPSIKPAPIDFTQQPGAVAPTPVDASGASRFAPMQLPTEGIKEVAPVSPPSQEKPKTNFFKKLFQKKEK